MGNSEMLTKSNTSVAGMISFFELHGLEHFSRNSRCGSGVVNKMKVEKVWALDAASPQKLNALSLGSAAVRSAVVQVFGCRHDEASTRCGGRRPKSAKHEIAGRGHRPVLRGYGDLSRST